VGGPPDAPVSGRNGGQASAAAEGPPRPQPSEASGPACRLPKTRKDRLHVRVTPASSVVTTTSGVPASA
jgi:hypothetical protein